MYRVVAWPRPGTRTPLHIVTLCLRYLNRSAHDEVARVHQRLLDGAALQEQQLGFGANGLKLRGILRAQVNFVPCQHCA